jgi:hypothetical protein
MIERGQDLRLAFEACEPVGIEHESFGQDFQRDVAIELRVSRPINLTHAARAERGNDFVRPESSAGCKRHGQL